MQKVLVVFIFILFIFTCLIFEGLFLKYDKDRYFPQNRSDWNELNVLHAQINNSSIKKLPEKHKILLSIKLPEPEYKSNISVEAALKNRRSRRRFKDESLNLREISQILWSAYGVTKLFKDAPAFLRGGFKTAPSAGALYPLELYLVVGDVDGLDDGVYKYVPEEHTLKMISPGDKRVQLARIAYQQNWLIPAPASIVYSAVYNRTTDRYGQRGRERYVCMDLGHSAENIYLQCETLNMATCAIGAFRDDELKKLLPLTQEEEPLYIMPIGKKQ